MATARPMRPSGAVARGGCLALVGACLAFAAGFFASDRTHEDPCAFPASPQRTTDAAEKLRECLEHSDVRMSDVSRYLGPDHFSDKETTSRSWTYDLGPHGDGGVWFAEHCTVTVFFHSASDRVKQVKLRHC